jgi:hypothetical protein
MDLTAMTEDEFLCRPHNCHVAGHQPDWDAVKFQVKNGIGRQIADRPNGYTIHALGDEPGNVVACANGTAVGIYYRQVLSVDPLHFGKGVATEMILAAVVERSMPPSRHLSPGGAAALRKAWRVANT